VCGVVNIQRVEICVIGSRGTTREFVSVSQVIFTPIVMFIKKIGPHPTSPTCPTAGVLTPRKVTVRRQLVAPSSSNDDDLPLVKQDAWVDLNPNGARLCYT
jgi:hypothetical protein